MLSIDNGKSREMTLKSDIMQMGSVYKVYLKYAQIDYKCAISLGVYRKIINFAMYVLPERN